MCFTVFTSSLMCHVCGCPGGGAEEGVEYCSGQCAGECKPIWPQTNQKLPTIYITIMFLSDPSVLGQPLPCPTGGCQALTIQLERVRNVTRTCLHTLGQKKILSQKIPVWETYVVGKNGTKENLLIGSKQFLYIVFEENQK